MDLEYLVESWRYKRHTPDFIIALEITVVTVVYIVDMLAL